MSGLVTVYVTGAGQVLHRTHPEDASCESGCVIHNPSDHTMKEFPTFWRFDRRIMERTCEHGVGHPDPDTIAFIAEQEGVKVAQTESVHGCDGCCEGAYTRFLEIEERSKPLTNSRGFDYFEPFPTSYGHKIRVHESSSVEPSIWLKVDATNNSCSDAPVELHAHLNLATAIHLRDQLTHLIENHYGLDEG